MAPNSFEKIRQAKQETVGRKTDASELTGSLNPQGRGGPVFDQMKKYMDTLGKTLNADHLSVIRTLFESKLRRRLQSMYNKYLQGRSGMPTHDSFEKEAEKAFRHGFDLYLKVFLRLDQHNAPKPHPTYRASLGGGATQRIVDQQSVDDYLKQYLTEGNTIEASLPRPKEEHSFEPVEGFEGYADKYQPIFEDDRESSALAAYMFEKLRIFADDFFNVLETSLAQGVPPDLAVAMAHYVYGTDARMYEDELLDTMTSEEIAQNAILNRTKAWHAFGAYKQYGKSLEAELSDGSHPWVHSKAMVRRLIFKYPSIAETGLRVVDREYKRITTSYNDVPAEILIDLMVKSPDSFEKDIQDFRDKAYRAMAEVPVPAEIYPSYQGSDNLFKVLGVEKEFMYRVWRAESGIKKDIESILKEFTEVHRQVEAKAQTEGMSILTSSKRMLLREFLLKRGNRKTIEVRANKRLQRQIKRGLALYSLGEQADPRYGHYYADLGHGNSDAERIENGKIITELILEQHALYGEDRAESYLQDLVELYYQYLDAGFETKGGDLNLLKDALTMDPSGVRVFYEQTLGGTWPEGVEPLPFDPNYQED